MKRTFSDPERAVISEMLALLEMLISGNPDKTRALAVLVFARLQKIADGAPVRMGTDGQIIQALEALMDTLPLPARQNRRGKAVII